MNEARAAARLIAATVQRVFGSAEASTRNALIEEHVAILCEPDAPAWHIARVGDRELLLVHDRARAWIAAWDAGEGSPRAEGWALPSSIERVIVGGPPGGYVVSGVGADDRAWFEREGFVMRGSHVDLEVTLDEPRALDARVRRARVDEAEKLAAWVAEIFASAWAREVMRSLRDHDAAVFVSEREGAYAGFAAHSGHNAAVGTFGPVGVASELRGAGLGAVLTRAALDDLFARGHRVATIPWVDPGRVAFYRGLVANVRVHERMILAKG